MGVMDIGGMAMGLAAAPATLSGAMVDGAILGFSIVMDPAPTVTHPDSVSVPVAAEPYGDGGKIGRATCASATAVVATKMRPSAIGFMGLLPGQSGLKPDVFREK